MECVKEKSICIKLKYYKLLKSNVRLYYLLVYQVKSKSTIGHSLLF